MKLSNDFEKEIEIWGGVECTVNRVGDRFFDQLIKNGHHDRIEDLDSFAKLGIKAIRYPVLWERVAPNGLENADWSWSDARLNRLKELGIRPIVGLLHHGSGTFDTSLVDPDFPEKFAAYAAAVAARYPWIDAYTPINEPLTTARFSGLYGFWYPHGTSDSIFARALFNQCRASVLAMRAIRLVNPKAEFIQTEDLGKTHSTPRLEYQAEFENERRWLTFDLLCGRVKRESSMRDYLRYAGIEDAQMDWFEENALPPDIIGLNYYLTSERYLDERTENYHGYPIGGNGRDAYVDVEAVRVRLDSPSGLRVLMHEARQRYDLPLAITEAHLGCTREEQLRWFLETWRTAQALKREGVDVRAVTAWSLLGSYDWNSLLTRSENHYESGAFDVRGGRPRPTALASLIKNIARKQTYAHPAIEGAGWWKRESRFIAPQTKAARASVGGETFSRSAARSNETRTKGLLITGATGTLGSIFGRICETRGLSYRLLSRREMDIADKESARAALEKYEPWAVVNAAGYVRVDNAESESDACFRENTRGAVNLAELCAEREISYLTFSSDLVFDGSKTSPYLESDTTNPLNFYGRSKARAEEQILEISPNALVVRTAAFFSPWDDYNFLSVALRRIRAGEQFVAANDNFVSPTYLPDLVNACLDLLIDGESGLRHLANQGALTWADFARQAAELAGLKTSLVVGRPVAELNLAAPRPAYSALGSERGIILPSLDDALNKFVESFRARL